MTGWLGPEEWQAIALSLRVSFWATLCSLPFGILAGYALARWRFPGRQVLNGLVHLPLILPPVVTGYLLLLTFGSSLAFSPQPPVAVMSAFIWAVSLLYGKRRWQTWALDAVAGYSVLLLASPGVVAAGGLIFRGTLAVFLFFYVALNAVFPIASLPKTTGPFKVAGADVFLQRNGLEFRVRLLHPAELSKMAEPAP
jgi:ABC-type Fe3+ transport system permease subunit